MKTARRISTREVESLGFQLKEAILKSLASYGHLDADDLSDPEKLHQRVLDTLKILHIGTDYRGDLITHAGTFWEQEDYEVALMMYATFFEHSINYVIVNRIGRQLSQSSVIEIVKSLPIRAKFGWLLELADLPKFKDEHRATIANVADLRNAFVHFKFPTKHIEAESDKDETVEREKQLLKIKKAVRYMNSYATRVVSRGLAKKIKAAVRGA